MSSAKLPQVWCDGRINSTTPTARTALTARMPNRASQYLTSRLIAHLRVATAYRRQTAFHQPSQPVSHPLASERVLARRNAPIPLPSHESERVPLLMPALVARS